MQITSIFSPTRHYIYCFMGWLFFATAIELHATISSSNEEIEQEEKEQQQEKNSHWFDLRSKQWWAAGGIIVTSATLLYSKLFQPKQPLKDAKQSFSFSPSPSNNNNNNNNLLKDHSPSEWSIYSSLATILPYPKIKTLSSCKREGEPSYINICNDEIPLTTTEERDNNKFIYYPNAPFLSDLPKNNNKISPSLIMTEEENSLSEDEPQQYTKSPSPPLHQLPLFTKEQDLLLQQLFERIQELKDIKEKYEEVKKKRATYKKKKNNLKKKAIKYKNDMLQYKQKMNEKMLIIETFLHKKKNQLPLTDQLYNHPNSLVHFYKKYVYERVWRNITDYLQNLDKEDKLSQARTKRLAALLGSPFLSKQAINEKGEPLLFFLQDHFKLLQEFLQSGGDPNVRDTKYNATLLHLLAIESDISSKETTIQKQKKKFRGAKESPKEKIKWLLQLPATNVNLAIEQAINKKTVIGDTFLHLIARLQDEKLLKIALTDYYYGPHRRRTTDTEENTHKKAALYSPYVMNWNKMNKEGHTFFDLLPKEITENDNQNFLTEANNFHSWENKITNSNSFAQEDFIDKELEKDYQKHKKIYDDRNFFIKKKSMIWKKIKKSKKNTPLSDDNIEKNSFFNKIQLPFLKEKDILPRV